MVDIQKVESAGIGSLWAKVFPYPMMIKNVTPASTKPEKESPGKQVANDALIADARYGSNVT